MPTWVVGDVLKLVRGMLAMRGVCVLGNRMVNRVSDSDLFVESQAQADELDSPIWRH